MSEVMQKGLEILWGEEAVCSALELSYLEMVYFSTTHDGTSEIRVICLDGSDSPEYRTLDENECKELLSIYKNFTKKKFPPDRELEAFRLFRELGNGKE